MSIIDNISTESQFIPNKSRTIFLIVTNFRSISSDNLINNLTIKKSEIRLVIRLFWTNFPDNLVCSNLGEKIV